MTSRAGTTASDPCVQRREWELTRPAGQVRSRVSSALGDPDADGTVTRWEYARFRGLFRCRVWLASRGRDSRVGYACHATRRTTVVELLVVGLLVAVAGVAAAVTYLSPPVPAPLDPLVAAAAVDGPGDVYGLVALSVAGLAVLTGLARGPGPAFPTWGLDPDFTTFAWPSFGFAGVLVLFVGLVLGAWLDQTAVVGVVFLFAFAVTTYANGHLPALRDGATEPLEAGEPLLARPNPHFNVAVLALMPAVLTVLGFFLSQTVAPTVPSNLDRPLVTLVGATVFPVALGVAYCGWCLGVLRRLRTRRIRPYRSRAGRAAILVGFLLLNVVVVVVTTAFLLMMGAALLSSRFAVDLRYDPAGIAVLAGAVGSLLAAATLGAALQYLLADADRRPLRSVRRGSRYANYLVLFVLFGVLSFAATNVVGLVLFGDGAILDPSPRTVRTNLETFLVLAAATDFVPLPDGPVVFGVYALLVFPVVVVGLSWAARTNAELRQRLAVAVDGERLDTADRPVPDSTPVVVADVGQPAVVQGGLLGPTKILVDAAFVAAVDGDERLDALLAHEAYHVANRDHLVTLAGTVGSFLLGGQNVLLAFYDLADSERAADDHAAEAVSDEALVGALTACIGLETDAMTGTGGTALGFVGGVGPAVRESVPSDAADVAALRERVTALLRRARFWTRAAALAPLALLFGGVVADRAHLDPRDRRALRHLPQRVREVVARETETATVALPVERTVTYPPSRAAVYDALRSRGATDESIDEAVESLLADGDLLEVRDDRLVCAEDWP